MHFFFLFEGYAFILWFFCFVLILAIARKEHLSALFYLIIVYRDLLCEIDRVGLFRGLGKISKLLSFHLMLRMRSVIMLFSYPNPNGLVLMIDESYVGLDLIAVGTDLLTNKKIVLADFDGLNFFHRDRLTNFIELQLVFYIE